ncbi:hypothetical protein [Halorussus sp. MSC15.2]|uniref:DUF7344 domain-containing protein n=1 Tax=Halorussus sp. MSC15.2 TaxID=2283638 RepID=UPI0013D082ED|nr:hypothetical protein [Halorussus sp. MSC15.2]NEU58131.1 hypothetical protein [Halorussus sp. MSC15.2]
MCDDTSEGGGDDETPPCSRDVSAEGERVDDLFDIVSDRRTRDVLAHLESLSVDVVELDDIVDYVVECERRRTGECDTGGEDSRETETNPGTDSSADAKPRCETGSNTDPERHHQRVAVSLHHNCLPKLDRTSVLDYDPRSKTVRYRGDERVTAFLELIESVEDP